VKILKTRSFSLILMVAVWFASLCTIASPAHACCPKTEHKQVTATLPDCCMTHQVTPPKLPPSTGGLGPNNWIATAQPIPFADFWASSQKKTEQAMLANRHWLDQSRRHQDLNVWLN
jgi:hypothetical protein